MAAREGRVLWEPSAELLTDSKMARYMRGRGLLLRMTSCGAGRWRTSRGFWRSLWELYEVGPAPERVLARARCRGRSGSRAPS